MLAVERPVVAVNRPSRRTEIFAQASLGGAHDDARFFSKLGLEVPAISQIGFSKNLLSSHMSPNPPHEPTII